MKILTKVYLFVFLLLVHHKISAGQYNNPYSSYGLGTYESPVFSQNYAMGGLSVAVRNFGNLSVINVSNPAAYSSIKLTCFDAGGKISFNKLAQNGYANENTSDATMHHFSIGVPVSKNSALALGIMPYSSMKYISSKVQSLNNGADSLKNTSEGSGSLSRFFLGYGITIFNKLSIGANFNYIFGKTIEIHSTELYNISGLTSKYNYTKNTRGAQFDLGTQLNGKLSKKLKYILGYSVALKSKINSTTSLNVSRFQNGYLDADTSYSSSSKNTINLPTIHKLGFSIENGNKWLIGTELEYGKWSSFNPSLNDSYAFALGARYTPDADGFSYLKLIDYRVGARLEQTYIKIDGLNINQYSLNAGLGLPLPSNRSSFSRLNLSFGYSILGTQNNNLIKESLYTIHIGLTMNDRWFLRSKYD